jgi:hypothetical protein
MIPSNFELLDNDKYFEEYFKMKLRLHSHMNFFRVDSYEKMIRDIVIYMKEEHGMDVEKHDSYMIYSTVIHQGDKNVLTKLFGKPKNTIRLGEGRASVWFMKINGRIVMLFADNRGMSVEIEQETPSSEYREIMMSLFKYLYTGYEKYNERLIEYIKLKK